MCVYRKRELYIYIYMSLSIHLHIVLIMDRSQLHACFLILFRGFAGYMNIRSVVKFEICMGFWSLNDIFEIALEVWRLQ